MRTSWLVRAAILCGSILLGLFARPASGADFIHPGLLHSRADLTRVKEAVAARESPLYEGYELLRSQRESQPDYRMHGPLATVGRNPGRQTEYDADANAAYQCALLWAITGDKHYAEKSKEIINAWSVTLRAITGRDAVLMAGLGPFKMVNAAEILRYTDAGWKEEEVKAAETHFRDVVYPVLKDFALYANGNWDTAAIKTMMAIAVFTNDRDMFERAMKYYIDGGGDGTIWHYIVNDAGQCQESGRDNGHVQLGLAHMGDCCEIAWQQGLDLYGYADNRLLKGFEYTARYNLGEEIPFVETLDRTGKYHQPEISPIDRGRFRPIYEQIYNHFVNRAQVPAPFTARVAAQMRPEGPGGAADHPGFGTLLFTRPMARAAIAGAPSAPAGLIAPNSEKGIKLTWVTSVGAKAYTVKRATGATGPFVTLARDVNAGAYSDESAEAGKIYFYAISASNAAGESADSLPVGACAGLPAPWKVQDIGAVRVPGWTAFDGSTFTLAAAGRDIGSAGPTARATVTGLAGRGAEVRGDQGQFACVPMTGTGTITARFVPQMSSQVSKFGVMMREDLGAESPMIALLIVPSDVRNLEAPGYRAVLMIRKAQGEDTATVGVELPQPTVTFGRLLGSCWLRLTRDEGVIRASWSEDGETWSEVAMVRMRLVAKDLLVGLCACSCLTTVTTRIQFDHIKVGPMTSTTRP